MAKNYDFTFFLQIIWMTFKLRQNAAIIFFITPITLFQQYLRFTRTNANKNVAFLNYLVYIVICTH